MFTWAGVGGGGWWGGGGGVFFFQAEDGIRDLVRSRGLGDVYKRQEHACTTACGEGKHVYACGEKGHACGTACAHAH